MADSGLPSYQQACPLLSLTRNAEPSVAYIRFTMKGMLIGLLAILVSRSDITAQSYIPLFGDSTRMWTSSISGSSFGDCLDTWVTTYWLDGDTMIDGTDYSIVRSRERHYESPIIVSCQSMTEYPAQETFVREEGHQVFARTQWMADTMIYDLDAQVGDTIPYPSILGSGGWGEEGWAEVLFVDSVLVNGTYRIRQSVSVPSWTIDTVRVIEGIGATTGPFGSLTVQLGLSHSGQLDCVREQVQVIFGNTWCELITRVPSSEIHPLEPPYPNPATDHVILDEKISAYHVLDTYGRTVFQGNGHKVMVHGISPGVYLVHGWDRRGIVVGSWTIVVEP
jgi:hypothetical protein